MRTLLTFGCFIIQCDLFDILHDDSWSIRLKGFFSMMWGAFLYILERSYVSLAGVLVLIMASFFFVPTKLSRKKRAIIGVLHGVAHLTSALILMLLLELGIEICIRNHLLATSGLFLFFLAHFLPSYNLRLISTVQAKFFLGAIVLEPPVNPMLM